jgi:hypothetical protein
MRFLISLIMTLSLASPAFAISFNDGRWSTTFNDVGACTQRVDCPSTTPDGVSMSWGSGCVNGKCTTITPAANYPNGGGGNGIRFWVGDGHNITSGAARVSLPAPTKELWIRWYARYEKGFNFNGLSYDKWLYLRTAGRSAIIEPVRSDGFAIIAQGTNDYYQASCTNCGFYTNNLANGEWHAYEVHMKMDTNGKDGIGRLWIDGKLVIENTSVDWSNGDAGTRKGWTWFDFHSNNREPANGRPMYFDYDDIAISTKGYIGPINPSGPGPVISPPRNLVIN